MSRFCEWWSTQSEKELRRTFVRIHRRAMRNIRVRMIVRLRFVGRVIRGRRGVRVVMRMWRVGRAVGGVRMIMMIM